MSEPIKPEDIREGDLIRREPLDSRSLRAVEYVAPKDGYTHGLFDSDTDIFFLLDRPTPAVYLPTEPTLGWLTSKHGGSVLGTWERYESSVRSRVGEGSALVRERDLPLEDVAAFLEAVAVPKAALDELRRDHGADLFEIDLDTAVVKFLAAVDAANGDPR